MDNLYSSLDCNQFKVGAHRDIEEIVIVFADQEPALPGDVQLYGEAHLGSEAGHAVLGPKRWPADTSRSLGTCSY